MKFTVAGYYGFGNLGDEAILESMVTDFRKEFPGASFDVIAADYFPTLSGLDISTVPWTDWWRVIESVRGCDWLIVGGGGLFNCYLGYSEDCFLRQSSNFTAFVFGLPALAYLNEKPSCIYGVGASRFYSKEALRHAWMAAGFSDVCTVRDRESRQILGASPEERARIAVHADPAFRLPNAPLPTAALAEAGIEDGEAVVGVALRNWAFDGDQTVWEHAVGEALRAFVTRHSIRLLFIPFHAGFDVPGGSNNDPAIISRMRAFVGRKLTAELPHGLRPGEVSAVLAKCQMVVAMRLHAAILSIRNATPFVVLNYEPKISGVLSECGLERFATRLPSDATAARRFSSLLEQVWEEKELIRQQLSSAASRSRADAGCHVHLLRQAVGEAPPHQRTSARLGAWVTQIAAEQTRRLAERDVDHQQASDEALSIRVGIRDLIDAGEPQPALRMLQRWNPRQAPTVAEREYLLGFCLQGAGGDPEAALEHYASALQLGFDEFWVLFNRGQLRMVVGDRAGALDDLKRACALRPDEASAAGLLKNWSEAPPAQGA